LDAHSVRALAESGEANFALENFQNVARLNGGFYTARGGNTSAGIKNNSQATRLQVQGSTAVGENGTFVNAGLDTSGDEAWLTGGVFTGHGGEESYGINVSDINTLLVAHRVSARAEAGTVKNYGLSSIGIETTVQLEGGSFAGLGGNEAAGLYDAAVGSAHLFTVDSVTARSSGASSSSAGLSASTLVTVTGSHLMGTPAVATTSSGHVYLGTTQLDGGYDGTGSVACTNSQNESGIPLDAGCQAQMEDGTAIAAVLAHCGDTGSLRKRFFNRQADTILVSDGISSGQCSIDFGFDLSARYWIASAVNQAERGVACEIDTVNNHILRCLHYIDGATASNGDIMVVIH
jgi:hypothetical protein